MVATIEMVLSVFLASNYRHVNIELLLRGTPARACSWGGGVYLRSAVVIFSAPPHSVPKKNVFGKIYVSGLQGMEKMLQASQWTSKT